MGFKAAEAITLVGIKVPVESLYDLDDQFKEVVEDSGIGELADNYDLFGYPLFCDEEDDDTCVYICVALTRYAIDFEKWKSPTKLSENIKLESKNDGPKKKVPKFVSNPLSLDDLGNKQKALRKMLISKGIVSADQFDQLFGIYTTATLTCM